MSEKNSAEYWAEVIEAMARATHLWVGELRQERDEARADVGRLESRVAAAEERAEYWREKAIPSQEAQRDEEYRALVVDRDEWKSAAKMGADEIALLEKERDTLQQRLDTIQVTLLSAYDGDAKNAATASEKLVTVGVVGLAAHIKTSLLVRANRVRELEAGRDEAREDAETWKRAATTDAHRISDMTREVDSLRAAWDGACEELKEIDALCSKHGVSEDDYEGVRIQTTDRVGMLVRRLKGA